MNAVGLFDSGVGGFTILRAVRQKLPTQNLIYFADQANLPYSVKSTNWLIQRSHQITQFLLAKGCRTIVIACNTATVAAIDHLRTSYPTVSFVGVEPAIKPAALHTQSGTILVLATQNTLQSQRLHQLCEQFAPDQSVVFQDMPVWVDLAESGQLVTSQTKLAIQESLLPIKNLNPKSIVLACTHYPFFKSALRQTFPNAKIFDPSHAVARQVAKMHRTTLVRLPKIQLFTTGNHAKLVKVAANLLPFPVRIQSIML